MSAEPAARADHCHLMPQGAAGQAVLLAVHDKCPPPDGDVIPDADEVAGMDDGTLVKEDAIADLQTPATGQPGAPPVRPHQKVSSNNKLTDVDAR